MMNRSFAGTAAVALRGDLEVEITRALNGPRRLVFDCWTKPELVKRWMHGPDDWEQARSATRATGTGSSTTCPAAAASH